MAFVLDPVVSAFLGWAINPLVRQVGYIVQVRRKVEDVDAAMAKLKARSTDLEAKVEAAEGRDPMTRRCSEVDVLLGNVRKIEAAVNATIADYEQRCKCVGGCLGNPYSSYKIGRRATKDQEEVLALFEQARALLSDGACVTLPLPPPPGQHMPGTTNLVAMDFRQSKILRYLADAVAAGEPRTVGIYGMGGVGKTTLLRAINNTLISAVAGGDGGDVPSFGHVIFADVTRNAQVHEVQERIAKGLKLPLAGNPDSRCLHDAIFNFLNSSRKRFVLLLDDIWEPLDLDEIGIPDGRRMVVFTTRFEAVCDEMHADKREKVECLSEEEAWQLFKSKVGEKTISSSAATEGGLARKIAAECKGLPLALVVLGTTMSSKHTRSDWQHTLTSLRKSPSRGMSCIQDPIFTVLKYSYDSLGDEAIRQCFLFLALIPYVRTFGVLGVNMVIEYFWGHGLIDGEGYGSLDEIYDLGYSRIIGPLKSACLVEFDDGGEIRVHDILVDMASWIACDCGRKNTAWVNRGYSGTKEPLKRVNDWEMAERLWLNGNDKMEVPPMPKRICEKLQTLVLGSTFISTIPESYFQYFPALTYLDLSMTSFPKLPEEVSELSELRYLDLSSSRIELLSMNLMKLKKLAHLRLTRCFHLNHIPYGLISSLQMLQSLDLFGSKYVVRRANLKTGDLDKDGSAEEDDDKNERAQALDELNLDELKILTEQGRIKSLGLNLEIKTTLDLEMIADDAHFRRLQLMGLQLDLVMTLLKVARDIEVLVLRNFQKLEELMLTTEQLDIGNEIQHTSYCFNKLWDLNLYNLDGLKKITWKRETVSQMFPRLTQLVIQSCHGLQNLTWTGYLPRLSYFSVSHCDGLEEIVSNDENVESSSTFPKLGYISLLSLPKLHSISQSTIDCPRLQTLRFIDCPRLKKLPFILSSQINTAYFRIDTTREWWENLECDGDCTKSHLERFVDFFE